jgi:multidrug resistance efflux pump
MISTKKLVEAIQSLAEANENLTTAEIALEEKKATIIQTDKEYDACTNEKQRSACLLDKCANEMKQVRRYTLLKMAAASKKEVAEIIWKSEKYDIMLKVGENSLRN